MKDNKWLRLLAYVAGLVNQELLLQNEYLAAENRILRAHLPARLRLSDAERSKSGFQCRLLEVDVNPDPVQVLLCPGLSRIGGTFVMAQ
jgi:hypothetical protein